MQIPPRPGTRTEAVAYRTEPGSILVKPYAVDWFNYWCNRLARQSIDEDTHSEVILEQVKKRNGMATTWASIPIELTGRQGDWLVEVKLLNGSDGIWWIPYGNILRVKQVQ